MYTKIIDSSDYAFVSAGFTRVVTRLGFVGLLGGFKARRGCNLKSNLRYP